MGAIVIGTIGFVGNSGVSGGKGNAGVDDEPPPEGAGVLVPPEGVLLDDADESTGADEPDVDPDVVVLIATLSVDDDPWSVTDESLDEDDDSITELRELEPVAASEVCSFFVDVDENPK